MRAALSVVAALTSVAVAGDDVAADFTADAKLYYREVACGGSATLPAEVDKATVDKHCDVMTKRYAEFQKTYAVPAEAFFAPLRPADLPTTIVYPFGGGDLASALSPPADHQAPSAIRRSSISQFGALTRCSSSTWWPWTVLVNRL